MKKFNMAIFTIIALMLFSACTNNATSSATSSSEESMASSSAAENSDSDVQSSENSLENEVKEFTKEELLTYNGKDGMPAYVAVDGNVYDVTDVLVWENGEHFRGAVAGTDLTEDIENLSPHGKSVLDNLVKVGILVED